MYSENINQIKSESSYITLNFANDIASSFDFFFHY